MEALGKEFDKVVKRQRQLQEESNSEFGHIAQRLQAARAAIAGGAADEMKMHVQEVQAASERLGDAAREAQSALHRFGKALDKRLKPQTQTLPQTQTQSLPQAQTQAPSQMQTQTQMQMQMQTQSQTKMQLHDDADGLDAHDTAHGRDLGRGRGSWDSALRRAIALHLVRDGRCDVARSFAAESRDPHAAVDPSLLAQFSDLASILDALRSRNVLPAIAWAAAHRASLEQAGSALEFMLHKLHFVLLLVEQNKSAALSYAKTHFALFPRHLKEIQQLMCAILFTNKLATSPYADFLNPHLWIDIQTTFSRNFCQLLGLSSDSPLFIAVTAGTTALPTIIKMSSIMKDKSGLEWSQQGELPVEIALIPSYRFHSVFACPVSKEQGSEDNPPMMMICGHVVCKESLARLGKGNLNAKFKCPYCPSESTASQATRVYF
eukprot:jgi/Hompol1/6825/HPOL_005095-RA